MDHTKEENYVPNKFFDLVVRQGKTSRFDFSKEKSQNLKKSRIYNKFHVSSQKNAFRCVVKPRDRTCIRQNAAHGGRTLSASRGQPEDVSLAS